MHHNLDISICVPLKYKMGDCILILSKCIKTHHYRVNIFTCYSVVPNLWFSLSNTGVKYSLKGEGNPDAYYILYERS